MKRTFFWSLISLSLLGLVGTGIAQQDQEQPNTDIESPAEIPETDPPAVDPEAGAPEEAGPPEDLEAPPLSILPMTLHIRTEQTHQFRVVGAQGEVSWQIEKSNPEGAATIDDTGMLTAMEAGEVVIGLYADGELLTLTQSIWVVGGPTRVEPERGGRVVSADDFAVNVLFPPQATQKAVDVLLERRDVQDLPEDAQGKGRTAALSIFAFNVIATETGEDVGEQGFEQPVELTLHYNDKDLPVGMHEQDLTIGTFNEHTRVWEMMPEQSVVAANTETNTITVAIPHASYWAVLDANAFSSDVPTAVAQSSWGKIKQLIK